MITKESLVAARNTVNEASLVIKQQYSESSNTIFVVVEGKDDIAYYGIKTSLYQNNPCKFKIISAGNRKKVVSTYDAINWEQYSKSRIIFIVDRDLSDFTGERTPIDENIYITDKYSIENDLCTFSTYLNALKYLGGLNKINELDESILLEFYEKCESDFFSLSDKIMGLILYWKLNGVPANYSSINCATFIDIDTTGLHVKDYSSQSEFIRFICDKSDVTYDDNISIDDYVNILKASSSPEAYTRGKYLLHFFVTILNFTSDNSDIILDTKQKGKMVFSIGVKDAIAKLSSVMPFPESLHIFFNKFANCSS